MEHDKQLDKADNINETNVSFEEENSELSAEQTDNEDTETDNGTDDEDNVKPFDINSNLNTWTGDIFEDDDNLRALVVGASGTGKTYALTKLLNNNDDFDFIYIISNSEISLDEYIKNLKVKAKVIKLKGYFNQYSDDLNIIFNELIQISNKNFDYHPKFLIIIDDALNPSKDRSNLGISDLLCNGRKRKISLVYLCQSPKYIIGSDWIDNVSLLLLFNLGGGISRQKLIDKTILGLGGLNRNQWDSVIMKTCKGHQALVMNLGKRNNDPHDMIKKYKA